MNFLNYVAEKLSGYNNSNTFLSNQYGEAEYRIFKQICSHNEFLNDKSITSKEIFDKESDKLSKEHGLKLNERTDVYIQPSIRNKVIKNVKINEVNDYNEKVDIDFENTKNNKNNENNENSLENLSNINFDEINSVFGLKFRDCIKIKKGDKTTYKSDALELKIRMDLKDGVEYFIKYSLSFEGIDILEQIENTNDMIFNTEFFLFIIEKFENYYVNSKEYEKIKSYFEIYKSIYKIKKDDGIIDSKKDIEDSNINSNDNEENCLAFNLNICIVKKKIGKSFNFERTIVQFSLLSHLINEKNTLIRDMFLFKKEGIYYTSCIEAFSNFKDAYSKFSEHNDTIIKESIILKNDEEDSSEMMQYIENIDKSLNKSKKSFLVIMSYPQFINFLSGNSDLF